MHSSYTFTAGSAVFDEQNLVSAAGLVPMLELAEQSGLSRLINEYVDLPSPAVFKIFRTVVRPMANASATCRLVCPDSYVATTSSRSRSVMRRRTRGGETNTDEPPVTATSCCTPVNNVFGLNRPRATSENGSQATVWGPFSWRVGNTFGNIRWTKKLAKAPGVRDALIGSSNPRR